MSRASGVVLILGGLAVAGYVIQSGEEMREATNLGLTEIPKTPVISVTENAAPAIVPPDPRPAFRAAVPARSTEAAAAPVVVTVAARPSETSPAAAPRAAPPKDRDALARELQKELRRVGCYEGELNGAWTPATRRAMKAFTDRVNATLPVDEPDPILYAMVQGQPDRVCGKPCPAGEGLSEDGRCVSSAILAKTTPRKTAPAGAIASLPKATERPAAAITGWSTTTTAAAVPPPVIAAVPPPDGRMALAGPAVETPPATVAGPLAPVPAARPASPPQRSAQRHQSWSRAILNSRSSPN